MENQGEETHYFQLNQLPDSVRFEKFRRDYINPLDSLLQRLAASRIDTSEYRKALSRIIPDWMNQASFDTAGGFPL